MTISAMLLDELLFILQFRGDKLSKLKCSKIRTRIMSGFNIVTHSPACIKVGLSLISSFQRSNCFWLLRHYSINITCSTLIKSHTAKPLFAATSKFRPFWIKTILLQTVNGHLEQTDLHLSIKDHILSFLREGFVHRFYCSS